MPAPIWPLDLPQRPQSKGYTRKLPNNQLRSEMDGGPDKVRGKGKAEATVDTVTYVMRDAQRDLFLSFVEDTLQGGVLCFDWPHPTLGRYVRARMVASSDNIANIQPWGDTLAWQVPLTVEYWPDATIA